MSGIITGFKLLNEIYQLFDELDKKKEKKDQICTYCYEKKAMKGDIYCDKCFNKVYPPL